MLLKRILLLSELIPCRNQQQFSPDFCELFEFFFAASHQIDVVGKPGVILGDFKWNRIGIEWRKIQFRGVENCPTLTSSLRQKGQTRRVPSVVLKNSHLSHEISGWETSRQQHIVCFAWLHFPKSTDWSQYYCRFAVVTHRAPPTWLKHNCFISVLFRMCEQFYEGKFAKW